MWKLRVVLYTNRLDLAHCELYTFDFYLFNLYFDMFSREGDCFFVSIDAVSQPNGLSLCIPYGVFTQSWGIFTTSCPLVNASGYLSRL